MAGAGSGGLGRKKKNPTAAISHVPHCLVYAIRSDILCVRRWVGDAGGAIGKLERCGIIGIISIIGLCWTVRDTSRGNGCTNAR